MDESKKEASTEQSIPEETMELLEQQKAYFERSRALGQRRAQRVRSLMERYSFQKLSPTKKERMRRRLANADAQASVADTLIDQITVRMSQHSSTK